MKRINLNIPKELLERLDNEAKKRYLNRTSLIIIILSEYLNQENK